MKRVFYFVILVLFMVPISVDASNNIYNIDIDVYLNEDGSADITEVWDVDGDDGTEWYKVMNDLGNMELSNFKVLMDGSELEYKEWNVNESLNQKRGYYGINYTDEGMELCFGKYDYGRHNFTLSYTLSNFIFNVDDAQVLYYNFIDDLSGVEFDNFSVDISSYYMFPDTLDVWGYGYEGYAYVSNGIISMINEDNSMNDDSAILLVKFPLNTFNVSNIADEFNNFDEVLNRSEKGTFGADLLNDIFDFLIGVGIVGIVLIVNLPFIIFIFILFGRTIRNEYGYVNNKKIDKRNVPMFRDIPCNKDIYYANTLIKLNNFDYKESNILGAILLKWVRNNMIGFKNEKTGIFDKETSLIDLSMNPVFDNELENKLFKMMYDASKDGMLKAKEFERWSRVNYSEFLNLFKSIENENINKLKENNLIYRRKNRNECKHINVMSDKIYEDSIQLYGLKKYLLEFSRIDTKEVMEVKLWDEYLMFAYLFGIADKVAKQFKNMYPEVIEQMENCNFDYNTIRFVNHISMRSVSAATDARTAAAAKAAQSYSSGGGGFSSSGGGGGSFGGGGGGSR